MKSVQERLLQFVRRDGRRDAPFVFLTIEDGGPMQSVPHLNETLDRDGAWEPETRTRLPYSLGRPGVIIPKLMTTLAWTWKRERRKLGIEPQMVARESLSGRLVSVS